MITVDSIAVAPTSKDGLEKTMTNYLSRTMPSHLNWPGKLNVEMLLDVCISKTHNFRVEICNDIGDGVEALTLPFEKVIRVTIEVYNGICNREGRHLFTGCHEVGHVIKHVPQIISWDFVDVIEAIRLPRSYKIPYYRNPEWQADYCAGALLMPKKTVNPLANMLISKGANYNDVLSEVEHLYGVSHQAADVRLKKLGFGIDKKPLAFGARGYNKKSCKFRMPTG